jgi:archaemetzincin
MNYQKVTERTVYDWTICYPRIVQLILLPVQTDLDCSILDKLTNDISREFENIKLTLDIRVELQTATDFPFSVNKRRNQWNSFKILEWLEKFRPNKATKILGIFDIDAYTAGFDFVFGEAFYRGRVAAIYLSRLRQEFYGLESNPPLFYERLVKEAIHELGHVYGLRHCKNSRCVMHFSTSLLDIDTKRRSFCRDCRKKNFR